MIMIYAADNAAFPYGAWKEPDLIKRIVKVVGALIDKVQPHVVVIALQYRLHPSR